MARTRFVDDNGKVRAAEITRSASGSWIGYLYANGEWSPYLDSEHAVMEWLQEQLR